MTTKIDLEGVSEASEFVDRVLQMAFDDPQLDAFDGAITDATKGASNAVMLTLMMDGLAQVISGMSLEAAAERHLTAAIGEKIAAFVKDYREAESPVNRRAH